MTGLLPSKWILLRYFFLREEERERAIEMQFR